MRKRKEKPKDGLEEAMRQRSVERGNQMYDYLQQRGLVTSYAHLARIIGVNNCSLLRALKGETQSTVVKMMHKINQRYGLFENRWIENGDGNMLRDIDNMEDVVTDARKCISELQGYERLSSIEESIRSLVVQLDNVSRNLAEMTALMRLKDEAIMKLIDAINIKKA